MNRWARKGGTWRHDRKGAAAARLASILAFRSSASPAEARRGFAPGSYEFQKRGISHFDLRDPYRIAVALTWPQFLAALLGLYLIVNVVFATLYWLVPGSVANARPNSFADVFFSASTQWQPSATARCIPLRCTAMWS
jgi:hypothetical protein